MTDFKCRSRPDQVQCPTAAVADARGPDPLLPGERAYVDEAWIEDLISELGQAYVSDTLHKLVRSLSEALSEIGDLHRQKNLSRAALIAHRTAGSTALFGLSALYLDLMAYEVAIADGESSVGGLLLQDLPAVLAATITGLQSCDALKSPSYPPIIGR